MQSSRVRSEMMSRCFLNSLWTESDYQTMWISLIRILVPRVRLLSENVIITRPIRTSDEFVSTSDCSSPTLPSTLLYTLLARPIPNRTEPPIVLLAVVVSPFLSINPPRLLQLLNLSRRIRQDACSSTVLRYASKGELFPLSTSSTS